MAKSKFFRVAVEGATTDGRNISRDWIKQMAATYSRAKYGARIFAEHIRGIMPDGPFRALGDVLAVKAEEITDGDLKGKFALLAQIEPSEAMTKLIRSGQKIYSSIEIDHDFTGSGTAYLVGLGITDSPASLGTDVLTFAAQHPEASPFAGRKVRAENLFSAGIPTEVELEEPSTEPTDTDAAVVGVFAKLAEIMERFSGKKAPPADPDPVPAGAPQTPDESTFAAELSTSLADLSKAFADQAQTTRGAIEAMAAHHAETDKVLQEFMAKMDTTPASPPRPAATGGSGTVTTDC